MDTQDNKTASTTTPVVNASANSASEDKTKEAEKTTSTEEIKVEEVKTV